MYDLALGNTMFASERQWVLVQIKFV